MRLLLVNRFFHPDESATSQLLSDLGFALAEAGHEVIAICSRQSYANPSLLYSPSETVLGVHIMRVGTTRFGRSGAGRLLDYLSFLFGALWTVFRMLRPGDVLVVKTDPPLLSVPMSWIANIRKARQVNWLQDVFPEVAAQLGVAGIGGPVHALLRGLRNRSLRQSAMNVVIGERMRDLLLTNDIPQDRIRVIHNWSDGDAIRPLPAASNSLRTYWGLSDKFVVGYSGNMGRAHAFDTLLEAMRRLANDARIHFLFIGDGRQLANIREFVAAHALSNVSLQPYQPRDRLGLSLTAPDVHVVTLKPELEGLIVPSKVYGAFAAGVPVVFIGDPAGEVGSMLAQVDALGISAEERDVDATVAAIQKLASDEASRLQMGRAARRAFDEHYSKKIALRRWISVLESISAADRSDG